MKVIKNYLYNVSYQILLMLVPLVTVPYVSRVLGPHNSGINSYTNSVVTFFYLFGQLGITLYGNRQIAYYREDKLKRSKCFWEIEILQLTTSLIAFIAYLTCSYFVFSEYRVYFLLQSLWIVATGLDISWFFMGMEDFKRTVTKNALVKIISIIFIFLLVKNKNDLGKYILLLGMAQLAGSLTLWPYLRNIVNIVEIQSLHPLKHLLPTIQLFIPTITTQIYLVVNRIMLGGMSTQSQVGQFDYADKIVKLILSVVTATGTVMLSHVSNQFAKGKIESVKISLYNSFDFVTSIAVPMMLGLGAIATKFAPWFLGKDYSDTGLIIIFESPAIIFIAWSSVIGNQYLTPINRVNDFTISVTVGAIVNVISNLILIYFFDALGAAVATVLSEFATTSIQIHYIRVSINRKKLLFSTIPYWISGLIMLLVVKLMNNTLKIGFFTLFAEVSLGGIIYIVLLILLKAPVIRQATLLYKKYIGINR